MSGRRMMACGAVFWWECKKIQSFGTVQASMCGGCWSRRSRCCVARSGEEEDYDDDSPYVGAEEDEADRPPPCSMLPRSFPTNRLYYSPDELERMGGEIRTDGKRVTRKDMLRQIESDWEELVSLLNPPSHCPLVGCHESFSCQSGSSRNGSRGEYIAVQWCGRGDRASDGDAIELRGFS